METGQKFIKKNLSFGEAYEYAKQGKLIIRAAWGGYAGCVFMRPADSIPVNVVTDQVKSLPDSVKELLRKSTNGETKYASGSPITIEFTPYLCKVTPDRIIQNGWLPSQEDLLVKDWMALNYM